MSFSFFFLFLFFGFFVFVFGCCWALVWFGVDLLGFWVFIYRYIYIYIYILVVPSLSELKIYAVLSRRVFNFWYD